MGKLRYIRHFSEVNLNHVSEVGGKNASLGEMYSALSESGVKVPNGFAVTAEAYRYFLEHNHLVNRINNALSDLNVSNIDALSSTASRIRTWISHGNFPQDVAGEIRAAYEELAVEYGPGPDVAVRSSATAEDLPNASFAGQQDTYLNISGFESLLNICKLVLASLFTDRAISYRVHQGFDHSSVALSIGVQKMVRSDKSVSGVMFTLDTESGFRDVVLITAAYGLGENVVSGAVNPDEFIVFKPTLKEGYRAILNRHLGDKKLKMVYARRAKLGAATCNLSVRPQERGRFAITDTDVLSLARIAVKIENHYSHLAGHALPMDIEWAKDGLDGELYIVQARPETVHANRSPLSLETYKLLDHSEVLVNGRSIGSQIGTGPVRIVIEAEHMAELQPGEVLVTDMTDPDWEPVMKIAAAIVTNRGGRVCHAAIIARELGIPAVVGTGDATSKLVDGQIVTVSCAEGDAGKVYAGKLPFEIEKHQVDIGTRPRTKIMLNVGNPDRAFERSMLPNDGVGLARLEFIITNKVGIHPRALLEFDNASVDLKALISEKITGYPGPTEFYINRLAEGVGTIAAAFYPKPVIVRMSDFKSNEYAALLGGDQFEPTEDNPMLGLRGAARYYSTLFASCFELECVAMCEVRDGMGLTNVELLIPFVRTVDELRIVIDLMDKNGLKREKNGLKIHTMCEVPSNALRAKEFLQYCDGFSIGSNDLTQLTLGVDRDSHLLSSFDERDEAVLDLIRMSIKACVDNNKYIGICGQAPSDFPEIVRWLVGQGIESISVSPDSVFEVTENVLGVESESKST